MPVCQVGDSKEIVFTLSHTHEPSIFPFYIFLSLRFIIVVTCLKCSDVCKHILCSCVYTYLIHHLLKGKPTSFRPIVSYPHHSHQVYVQFGTFSSVMLMMGRYVLLIYMYTLFHKSFIYVPCSSCCQQQRQHRNRRKAYLIIRREY